LAGLRAGNGETEFDPEVSVAVEVGTGVIGENIRGFGVAVGCEVCAAARAGNVCAGCTIGMGVGVASALQAVSSTQTTKIKYSTRCIAAKYSGRKLSGDESYEEQASHGSYRNLC
jgi:hypothetical protein